MSLPTNGTRQLLLIFSVTMVVTMGIFYAYNRSLHNRETQIEYNDCLSDQQLAANQRRVLNALLIIAQHHPDVQQRPILFALARVPDFYCDPNQP